MSLNNDFLSKSKKLIYHIWNSFNIFFQPKDNSLINITVKHTTVHHQKAGHLLSKNIYKESSQQAIVGQK